MKSGLPNSCSTTADFLKKTLGGRAMAQVVSRQPLTTEAWVHPCGICGGQSGTGTGFSSEFFGFPLSVIIPLSLSTIISSWECVIYYRK
jgi:hypothetical protein